MRTMDTARPFLWGPVKNALLEDIRKHGPDTAVRLCFTDQQRVKEMLVQVLTDLGRDEAAAADPILHQLFPLGKEPGRLQRVRDLIRRPEISTDVETRNAVKIAIEVASNLGVLWVLQAAVVHPGAEVRALGVRYTYHLWQRDADAAYTVLEYAAHNVMHGPLPNTAALESALGLSLIIFFDHPRDRAVLTRLQMVWRGIIDRVFAVQGSGGRAGKLARDFIRERIFSFAVTALFRMIREMPEYNVVNYPDVEAFFHMTPAEKALQRRLVRYLDVQGPYSQEEMEADVVAVLPLRDLITGATAMLGVGVHTYRSPAAWLPFLARFARAAEQDPRPSPYVADIPQILTYILNDNPHDDEVFAFFVRAVEACQQYYELHQAIPGLHRKVVAAAASFIGPYVLFDYQRTGTARSAWLQERIDRALRRGDLHFFKYILQTDFPLVGLEMHQPQVALDAVSLVYTAVDANSDLEAASDQQAAIRDLLSGFLARMHLHYPDEVDDFLEEHQAPLAFRIKVTTNEPRESVGELIGGARTWLFVVKDIAIDSAALRPILMQAFEKASDFSNARSWIDYLIRQILNVVYGAPVLSQPR